MLYLIRSADFYNTSLSGDMWKFSYKIKTERPSPLLYFTKLIISNPSKRYLEKYAILHGYEITE